MTSVPSATTWGSPTATKHALLLHGMTSSSHTWHRVASSLAAQGYFVTAPNLIGHASRVVTDYRLTSMADDLRPYLEARNYSLIIGHSLGGTAVLALCSHLPSSHPTAVVLVDPPMNVSPEGVEYWRGLFIDSCTNVQPAGAHGAENPLWTREDSIYRELGIRLCSVDAINGILNQNRPWHFFDDLNTIPKKWKVAVLVADPAATKLSLVEDFEPYPRIRPVTVAGAGHWIQYEFPKVIVDEALKTVAELETA